MTNTAGVAWDEGEALDAVARRVAAAGPDDAREALIRLCREEPLTASRWLAGLLRESLGEALVRHALAAAPAPVTAPVVAALERWLDAIPRPAAPPLAAEEPPAPVPEEEAVAEVETAPEEEWAAEVAPVAEAALIPEVEPVAEVASIPEAEPNIVADVAAEAEATPSPELALERLTRYGELLRRQAGLAPAEAPPVAEVAPAAEEEAALARLERFLGRIPGAPVVQEQELPRALQDLMRFHDALVRLGARA